MSEKEWIRWLREHAPKQTNSPIAHQNSSFANHIGDDAALTLDGFGDGLLSCADILLDGVHFDTSIHSLESIGRKSLAVNLSDIAAMGGLPFAALATIALPSGSAHVDPRLIYAGLFGLAKRHDVAVLGGDTTSWKHPMAISVTVLGRPGRRTWTRDGAKAGDRVLVSGFLGGSILGKHLTFEPQLKLADHLNQLFEIGAAIDLSDGLASDLRHICEASGVGAVISTDSIPVSPDAHRQSTRSGHSAMHHALCDGEDFELLFTATPEVATSILQASSLPANISDIGEITEDQSLVLIDENRQKSPFPDSGFEHQFPL